MQWTPILQFGTSRFLQAHADLFISQAMQDGQEVGPITVVQSSGDPRRAARLAALVGSYTVRVEGLIKGKRVQEALDVTSVARTLSTSTDWDEVARVFVEEAKIVSTELKGWLGQVEMDESVARAQIDRLVDDLADVLPALGLEVVEQKASDTVIALPHAAE